MATDNKILIYVTDSTTGNLIDSTPVFSNLSSIDSSGAPSALSTYGLISITPTGVTGVYTISLNQAPFFVNGAVVQKRFIGTIDCGENTSPRYQPFDYRPEDFDTTTSSDVLTSVANMKSVVDTLSAKKYIYSGKKPDGTIDTWTTTDSNYNYSNDSSRSNYTEVTLKGSFI